MLDRFHMRWVSVSFTGVSFTGVSFTRVSSTRVSSAWRSLTSLLGSCSAAVVLGLFLAGCGGGPPAPGPDRQAAGTFEGAATGAGAGAVTGFQLGAGTGPGALVGAGLGAVAGGIQGAVQDSLDEDLLKLSAQARAERERLYAQDVLQDEFKRRLALHPTREIYAADLFFRGDETRLRLSAKPVVRELARLNKERASWSRLVVAAYVKASSPDSEFAQRLGERRARELVDELVRGGLEPRRLQTRVVITSEPILIDPLDRVERYSQAIELIALDS